MVVARKVKKSVENQAPNIGVKCENGRPPGLLVRGLGGNQNVAQIISTTSERQDIRRLVESSILSIVLSHHWITDEYNGKLTGCDSLKCSDLRQETLNAPRINRVLALFIQDKIAGLSPTLQNEIS